MVGIVLALLSFLMLPLVGGVGAILLGRASRRRMDADSSLGPRGLATASIWLGAASLVFSVVTLIFLFEEGVL